MGSEKYDLSKDDFIKALRGATYTFLGSLGALMLPLADQVRSGQVEFNVFLLAVAASLISVVGNLLYRFFTDTTK